MKVICIKLSKDTDSDSHFSFKLSPKLHHIYEVEECSISEFGDINYYIIKEDISFIYPASCFISLDEYRDKQIDLIIN